MLLLRELAISKTHFVKGRHNKVNLTPHKKLCSHPSGGSQHPVKCL